MIKEIDNSEILKTTGQIFNCIKKKEALCNDVYVIVAENGRYILKIAHDKDRQNELLTEYTTINSLQGKTYLPKFKLFVQKSEYSFLLMDFIDGTKPIDYNYDTLKKMADVLKQIHSCRTEHKYVDFDKLLEKAKQNMNNGKLDYKEFYKNGIHYNPSDIFLYLIENKPKAPLCLLHGDFRPKNMLLQEDKLYVIDFGLSFWGDPYYDLAIIKYYFSDEEFKTFLIAYGIDKIDKQRLYYNEWLSAFLNV